ncbi:MAG: response regulator, partial [Actinomycetota bacterium]
MIPKLDELSVLIVEDEEQVRAMLKRLLDRAGHETWEASNCAEAAEAMEAHDFALALVDVNLPGMSGLELTKQIVASHPNTAVIMVTGIGDPVVAASALNSGAYGYLVKPFKSSAFTIERTNALIRRRLEMENRAHMANLETRVLERTHQL